MKYFLILTFGYYVLFSSCKKTTVEDNNCSSIINSGILAVNPSTLIASVNQDISFELSYSIANGCGVSSTIESVKDGNIVTVNMMTKFEGCICTEIYKEEKKSYIFKSPIAGSFKLKFGKGNNTFIEKDVVIQ